MTVTLRDVKEVLTAWVDETGDDEQATWFVIGDTDKTRTSLTFEMVADVKDMDYDESSWADRQQFEITIKEVVLK